MKLNTLNRTLAVSHTHQQAALRVRARLQTIRQSVCADEQAVIATDLQRCGEALEEAAAVMLDQLLMPVDWFGLDQLCAEVLSDGLVPEADSEDGEILGGCAQALHRHPRSSRAAWAGPDQESSGLQSADSLPVRSVRAQNFNLSPELLEELNEVEGEGVSVVEDQNHRPQDASRALRCKLKAKKQGWGDCYLAQSQSWNKVPA